MAQHVHADQGQSDNQKAEPETDAAIQSGDGQEQEYTAGIAGTAQLEREEQTQTINFGGRLEQNRRVS